MEIITNLSDLEHLLVLSEICSPPNDFCTFSRLHMLRVFLSSVFAYICRVIFAISSTVGLSEIVGATKLSGSFA
jgi:hypothetical protein